MNIICYKTCFPHRFDPLQQISQHNLDYFTNNKSFFQQKKNTKIISLRSGNYFPTLMIKFYSDLMICLPHIIFTNMFFIPFLLMFGGYAAFSLLLFCFPTLLHKKIKHKVQSFEQALNGSRFLRVAHRGGPRYTTQNTIEAFKRIQQHCDMLEMDVCETKDGILVVHHDEDLSRTCGVQKKIREFNNEDLPPFKKEIPLNFAQEGRTIRSNNEKIPTLEEVFKTFPDMPMNIQLKTPTKSAVKAFMSMIKEYNRRHITIVGIRGPMQEDIREADLNGLRWMNDTAFYRLLAYYFTGLLPFVHIEDVSLQPPLYTEQFYHWKIREWGNNKNTHLYFLTLRVFGFILRPLMSHLKKRGILVIYWVCNSELDYRRAIEAGGCGAMTDDPVLLDQYVKSIYPNEEKSLSPSSQSERKME